MENQLVKQVMQVNKIEFTPEQVGLIKSQIAKGATDDELKLFLYQCQQTGLNPLSRQIYFMKRRMKQGNEYVEKMSVQTSIDGFRVIAERSGDYGGQDEPVFEVNSNGQIVKATVKVYRFRGDIRYCAAVGVAYMNEYMPSPGQDFMWKKMPSIMLSKVAEALALRKAYPQDLSGLYTNDEMNQAEKQPQPEPDTSKFTQVEVSPVREYPASQEQMIWIESLMQTTSASEEKVIALERRIAEGLTTESAEKAIEWLKQNQISNIEAGKNYSQSDITNKIKSEIL